MTYRCLFWLSIAAMQANVLWHLFSFGERIKSANQIGEAIEGRVREEKEKEKEKEGGGET